MQSDVFCARAVGAVSCYVWGSGVVSKERYTFKQLSKSQLGHHVGYIHRLRACEMSSASRVDYAVTFWSAVLKLRDPPASMSKYPEVDLPLSGLFPQLASQYPVISKHPVLYVIASPISPFR